MAAGEGFEPSQTESESGVLPLHNPAKCRCYYSLFFQKVKCFLKFVFIAGGTVFTVPPANQTALMPSVPLRGCRER